MIFSLILTVELIIFLMILPLKINAKIQFSLDRQKCFITIHFMRLNLIVIRLYAEKGCIRMSINGKRKRFISKSSGAMSVLNDIKSLIKSIYATVLIGGDDACCVCCACSAVSSVVEVLKCSKSFHSVDLCVKCHPSFDGEAFVFVGNAVVQFAIFDLIEILLVYGIRRNIKANN
jgi:hypothetical protein